MSASTLDDVRGSVAHGVRLTSRYRSFTLYERQRSEALEVTLREGEPVGDGGASAVEDVLLAIAAKMGRTASTLDRLADIGEQSVLDEYARWHRLCLALPLTSYGSLIGAVVLHYDDGAALPDAEFAALKRFLDFAAVALGNAKTREELLGYAITDPLTGLGNRRYLDAELARLRATRLALLLIDFDDLKAINDTLGYEHGDRLIASIGVRLAASARPDELPVRLGGDEFVVILPGADREHAVLRAEQMTAALDGLVLDDDLQRLFHGASVGWAVAEPGEDPWQVLNRAALEMRSRKRRRKGDRRLSGDGADPAVTGLDVWRSREEI